MTTGIPGPSRGAATTGPGAAVQRWSSGRRGYVDTLKVLLVAIVIAGHAVLGYASFTDAWSYSDVREVTLASASEIALIMLTVPPGILVIPLLFLIAGLLTPPSLRRHGTSAYVRARLLRLGVPFVVFAVLLWPLLEYALFRVWGGAPGLAAYLRQEGSLDTGVLWFVGALLAFSLAYAGWTALRQAVGRPAGPSRPEIGLRQLLGLAAAAAAVTFLVRTVLPYESDNPVLDLNMWEWPVCAAVFGLGVLGADRGWLAEVPPGLRRRCGVAALAAFACAGLLMGAALVLDLGDSVFGGWSWASLAFTAVEAVLSLAGAVWVLALAQHRLDRPFRWAGPAVARSAYGAFLIQGPVLLGLALALRVVPLPAEVKALLVAALGVAASFWLAWLLVARVPLVRRVL